MDLNCMTQALGQLNEFEDITSQFGQGTKKINYKY
jgi:hypothetical protein